MYSNLILILIISLIDQTYSYVDLFLNSNETKSLIGYPGSLFYIFNGEIRSNSIQHRLEIPETKSDIEFNWKTTGPLQMFVDYNLTLNDLNSTNNNKKSIHNLTINKTGHVPFKLDIFKISFNCSLTNQLNQTDYYIDFIFNLIFSLNNSKIDLLSSQASIDLQLITIPPLNLTIQLRKYCTKKTYINNNLNNQTNSLNQSIKNKKSNFTIFYFIFTILALFSLIIFLSCIYMYTTNRAKFKKSLSSTLTNTSHHSKYESLNKKCIKENMINEEIRSLNSNKQSGQFKKNNTNLKKCKQLNNQSLRVNNNNNFSQNQTIDSQTNETASSPDIYETVPDQSVNITNTNQSSSKYKNRLALNLTTNTIQSTSVPFNLSTITTSRRNLNQIDLCVKYKMDQIEIGSIRMEGTFSKIHNGYLKLTNDLINVNNSQNDENENETQTQYDNIDKVENERIRVMIKMVNDNASKEQVELMLKESCMFRGLKHKNLSTILGICLDLNNNPIALFNHFEIGNLKTYFLQLKKKRKNNYLLIDNFNTNNEFDNQPLISTQELLYIILQLLKGVNYLHSKHVVHKDIATRNCWLDSNFSLKLSDYALSRDMFPQDYHCLANNENKPINWMSLETLTNNVYNIRTDIWSCGVFIWECFTLSNQPYEMIDPFEFTDYLLASEENRLERPINCPEELFDVFSKCWLSTPNMRPSLKELFNSIHKFYNALNNYV